MAPYIYPKLYPIGGPTPDDFDQGMKSVLLEMWDSHFRHSPDLPRVGDYVITPPDGKYQRAAYEWPDHIQTCDSGSFHMGTYGASMSGSLDTVYWKEQFVPTGETKEGYFWFFHHNHAEAHNGVGLSCSCRVFKVKPLGGMPAYVNPCLIPATEVE